MNNIPFPEFKVKVEYELIKRDLSEQVKYLKYIDTYEGMDSYLVGLLGRDQRTQFLKAISGNASLN